MLTVEENRRAWRPGPSETAADSHHLAGTRTRQHDQTRTKARADIFNYIERCHNPRQR